MKPWKILSSRQTYKDKWLSVRTDTVELQNGMVLPDFHVIEFRDWVNILALTENGDVLIIREYRHGCQAITLGVPAGSSEEGETDLQSVAERELLEETGYQAREMVRVGIACADYAKQTNNIHFFLALGAHKVSDQKLDASEDIEVLTMPYTEYLDFAGIDIQQTHHAALLHYVERYFARHPEKNPCR